MLNIIVCICLYLCRWSFGADKSRVHKLEELQETVRVTKNAKNDVAAGNCKGYCLVYGCLCSIFLCILYSRDKLPKEDSFSDLQGDRIALLIFFFFISRFIVLHFSDLKDYLSCPSFSFPLAFEDKTLLSFFFFCFSNFSSSSLLSFIVS